MRKIVLDTNIVLDLWVFGDERVRPLASALADRALHWIATRAMRDELERVLAYTHIAARVAARETTVQDVLARFDAHTALVEAPLKAPVTCRDADDQKFIDLAVAHACELISKDKAVLSMKRRLERLQVKTAPVWAA